MNDIGLMSAAGEAIHVLAWLCCDLLGSLVQGNTEEAVMSTKTCALR